MKSRRKKQRDSWSRETEVSEKIAAILYIVYALTSVRLGIIHI